MKHFLFILSFFLAVTNCFSADWAVEKLDASKQNYQLKYDEIAKQREEILNRIDKLNKEISNIDNELRQLDNTQSQSVLLDAKSKFYNDLAEDIAGDLKLFFNLDIDLPNLTLSESKKYLQNSLKSYIDDVLNPSKLEDCVAQRIKTDELVNGQSFYIGGFKYFFNDDTAGFLTVDNKLYMENYKDDIKNYIIGDIEYIPADISDGKLYNEVLKQRSIIDSLQAGGVWIYPIIFFGLLSTIVFIRKFFSLILIKKPSFNQIKAIQSSPKPNDLLGNLKYPYKQLIASLIESKDLGSSIIEEVAYEQMLSVGQKLFSGLSVLSVTAGIAPLLGLLGTVTGIIKTFADLSTKSAQHAMSISEGISEALITTEYGLIVAIPAFVAHAILSRRAKSVMSEMEKISSKFLSNLK